MRRSCRSVQQRPPRLDVSSRRPSTGWGGLRMFSTCVTLASFSSQYGSYPGMLMAVTTVITVPIIALFFFAQRTFIQGITLTGIKG